MLGKRILTALIGILAAIYLINSGGWLFIGAVALLAVIAWHEYFAMLGCRQINVHYGLGVTGILLLMACTALGNPQETIIIMFLLLVLCLAKAVTSSSSFTIADASFTFFGIAYVGLTFSHIILLRFADNFTSYNVGNVTLPAGAVYLWLAFVGTWANDTFAYFVGTKFGQNKLCPAISPYKTWEGAIGGIIGSLLGTAILGSLFQIPLFHGLIIGLLAGIAAPLGDLAESAIKRYTGVKDSGRLLPGHGGVLDRFDSIMFAVPTVYYYIYAFLLN
ncbi:phosphatidate cytidylyltransferase [Sporolituus thermophilus]|uniref:Phosphatidate cytidylyltransferase n=1 Tax=Sporolituus thermophilus DSM 23256 TaxID=1123285 RepID=A0A1G7KRI6_9FIRM|nr:phosphatidate cytidylyltransferase [Sporolituus thermophilus]SDF39761.1 phosphatidate cytidylyltransferase [Sporolituus thermophilus DSM 23256]